MHVHDLQTLINADARLTITITGECGAWAIEILTPSMPTTSTDRFLERARTDRIRWFKTSDAALRVLRRAGWSGVVSVRMAIQ